MSATRPSLGMGARLVGWRKLADLDVAEGDGEAVILKQDVAVVRFAKVWPDVILAVGDELAELRGEALVLDDLDAVEPVFAMGAADDDACGVPLADGLDGLVGCGG